MNRTDFAVFILSHGRPDNVLTYKTLKEQGYTGKIYLIVDAEDKTADRYKENFGSDNVLIFSKKSQDNNFDIADNFDDRRAVVFARNACFELGKRIGIQYFMQLDDDYTSFRYRYQADEYITKGKVKSLDAYFKILLEFYISSNIDSVTIAQGGDFIGGASCGLLTNYEHLSRKAMNSFICNVDKPFKFVGRINEDVNTYVHYGSLGLLQLTIPHIALEQLQTQSNNAGLTDIYLSLGTYVKSFYTVIFEPSSVKVKLMGFKNNRMHHSVKWINAVPKILDEKYKK